MAIFITGATGYLGSYIVAQLLREYPDQLNLLVRANNQTTALARLWHALQLHFNRQEFDSLVRNRCQFYLGNLTTENLALSPTDYQRLLTSTDSIIHCAASLNRSSERSCLNTNLRGSLTVIQLARKIADQKKLRRYSMISTVAIAGERKNEVVSEDKAIDWRLEDFDPYARTKKFCEYMTQQLLPEVTKTIFRPSIVLGDSRFPQTTQFDMIRAFVALANLKILPFNPNWLLDIVPANYVGNAIVKIHQKEKPEFDIYHLSSGKKSPTFQQISDALVAKGYRKRYLYTPKLNRLFTRGADWIVNFGSQRSKFVKTTALLKVFLPYLNFNTVFDNQRVVSEIKTEPVSFADYAYDVLTFAKNNHFTYPYEEYK